MMIMIEAIVPYVGSPMPDSVHRRGWCVPKSKLDHFVNMLATKWI